MAEKEQIKEKLPIRKPSNEERIKKNEELGYFLVGETSGGDEVYKKKNEAGGWTYYGESCSIFDVIWDNCCSNKEEFLIVAKDCYNLEIR